MSSERTPVVSAPLTEEQLADLRRNAAAKLKRSPSPQGSQVMNGSGCPGDSSNGTSSDPGVAMPITNHYRPRGSIPNTPLVASLISAALGALVGAALFATAAPVLSFLGSASWGWARPQLGLYVTALGLFHLLEYWTTAGWNYQKLSVDAFLLNNTSHYHIAHAFGMAEYLLSSYFWPSKFDSFINTTPYILLMVSIMALGQSFRSLAMVHAAQSFSHIVKIVKLEDHTLVTTGVYAWVRHPSYVGFYYWALATQLLMGNVISTIAFMFILGRFFSARIKSEEVYLIRFFGDKYIDYSRRVGSGLPFLSK